MIWRVKATCCYVRIYCESAGSGALIMCAASVGRVRGKSVHLFLQFCEQFVLQLSLINLVNFDRITRTRR